MPEDDVILKANWSKLNIIKSTEGTVSQGLTLYGQVLSDSKNSTKYAKKYTGDTSTFTGNNDVYYYYGAAANNNVIFANYCWKIVRTTDTGGVKLLYNGVPSNGTCNNTGDASTLTASQMGTSSNTVAFNTNSRAPADVGYMYNTRYEYNEYNRKSILTMSKPNDYFGISYADNYEYKDNLFYLIDSTWSTWDNCYTNLVGKYVVEGFSGSGSNKIYYVVSTTESTMNCIEIEAYKFGHSFTWNGSSYDLDYTKILTTLDKNDSEINDYNYTCFNQSGNCTELNYIYYANYPYIYYIKLRNGKSVEDALNEMLYNNDVNKNNSTIKTAVDYWYRNNMTNYTSYLEDTVWCNDRSIYDKGGWNPLGGNLSSLLYFNSYNNTSNLTCANKNDRFTVNSLNGNGALTYPVGLITEQERTLAYSSNISPLAKNIDFWGLSPINFAGTYARNYIVGTDGNGNSNSVSYTSGISPAVSLRTGIEYKSGDGSSNHPYIIVTDNN